MAKRAAIGTPRTSQARVTDKHDPSAPPLPTLRNSQHSLTQEQRDRLNKSRLAALARKSAREAVREAVPGRGVKPARKPRLMPIPPNANEWVNKSADEIMDKAAPLKSAFRYDQEWQKFEEFRGNSDEPEEADYLKYFNYLHEGMKFKASTLWKMYGMLNSNHQRKYGRRLQYWPRLKKLLNRYKQGYVRKRASILSLDQIKQALQLEHSTPKWVWTSIILLAY